MVNTFGNAYSKDAATDLGVPLLTTADITQKTPKRSTVKQVYDQLIADIKKAIPLLPSLQEIRGTKWRASKEGAEGLLARLYYYMNDYPKALVSADKALAANSTLLDYDTIDDLSDFGVTKNSEEIFIKRSPYLSFYLNFMSKEQMDLFEAEDLRLSKKFNLDEDDEGNDVYEYNFSEIDVGIAVPEMLLIKAEAQARLDNLTGAVATLNTLREKRFSPADYVAFAATDKEEIIKKILVERRLELSFIGLRWFDMKKQAKEGRMGTVIHKAFGKEYKLEPNSLKYTLQIPEQVINFSPQVKQNPR